MITEGINYDCFRKPSLTAVLIFICITLTACGPTTAEIESLVDERLQVLLAEIPTVTPRTSVTPSPTSTPQPTPTVVPFPPTPTPFQLLPTPTPITLPPPATTIPPLPTVTPQPITDFQKVYANIWQSVFMIKAGTGHGTGWFLEPGIIVTNEHVIRGYSTVFVYQNAGQPFEAEVISSDSQRDIAVLRFDETSTPLPIDAKPLTLGNVNNDHLAQPMMALGYSGEYPTQNSAIDKPSANVGVLSLIIDFGPQSGGFTLVMDVPVDPGDSGGPVVNSEGAVMGMTRGVVERSSAGQRVVGTFYALHVDEIKRSLPALKAGLSR